LSGKNCLALHRVQLALLSSPGYLNVKRIVVLETYPAALGEGVEN
jgi:hypothetical protein